jgi:hypothetical protein
MMNAPATKSATSSSSFPPSSSRTRAGRNSTIGIGGGAHRDALAALSPFVLPQHADQYRPERPVLFAVDEKLGKRAALRVAPELSDPIASLEVGQHEDVQQLGAWSGG